MFADPNLIAQNSASPAATAQIQLKQVSVPLSDGSSVTLSIKAIKSMGIAGRFNRSGATEVDKFVLTGVLQTSDPSQLVVFVYSEATKTVKVMLLEDRFANFGCSQTNQFLHTSGSASLPLFLNQKCNEATDFALTRMTSTSTAYSYTIPPNADGSNQSFTASFLASRIERANGHDRIVVGGFGNYQTKDLIWMQILDADNPSDNSALTLK